MTSYAKLVGRAEGMVTSYAVFAWGIPSQPRNCETSDIHAGGNNGAVERWVSGLTTVKPIVNIQEV